MTRRIDLRIVLALALVAAGFFLGSLRNRQTPAPGGVTTAADAGAHDHAAEAETPTLWTCSMHPQIKLPKPGKCPICGMDLIPLEDSGQGADDSEIRLSMSEAATKLAEVQTVPVQRVFPRMEVRLVGKVDYDETRVRKIAAWVGGRLDRLYVDYTGVSIRKGDHLVEIYSPELVSAQEELLQSLTARSQITGGEIRLLKETANRTVEAAREKLRLLGLTPEQIAAIEKRGEVDDHVVVYAPIDGIVIAKHAVEGAYVKTGTPIYDMADLSHLWVKIDAYESDLVWLRYGQRVTFTTEAYPGQEIVGRIAFIDPTIDPKTRTAKVRVNVDNSDGRLKPGMFVRAVVLPEIASAGRVMEADLAGKWVCPMHPEIVEDGPGACPICGMDLVRPGDLGYAVAQAEDAPPLVIPASAPLITGKRAVVYVRVPGTERPTFEGREVVLGPRAGDVYIVESGLAEGEMVVARGAFKIDSSMQIQAKPSMMNPEGGVSATGHHHGGMKMPGSSEAAAAATEPISAPAAFEKQLGAFTDAYFGVTSALAADDLEGARRASKDMAAALGSIDMGLLEGNAHMEWMGLLRDLEPAVQSLAEAKELDALRAALPAVTTPLSVAIESFGLEDGRTALLLHCPMAFDGKGADWIQPNSETANPYFGTAMPKCGDVSRKLTGEGE